MVCVQEPVMVCVCSPHDFLFAIPTFPSTMPGTPEGVFLQGLLVEQMVTLRPFPCLRPFQDPPASVPHSTSILPHLICGSFSWLGYLILPLILCSEAPGFPSLCPRAFQEIVRFPVSQSDGGKQLLGWTREPATHLP